MKRMTWIVGLSIWALSVLLAGCPAAENTTVNVPPDPLPPADATAFSG